MPYRRSDRPSWYSQVRTRAGWTQLCWRTSDKPLARKMEAMWEELANAHRAWDCLEPVLSGTINPGELYDFWRDSGRNVEQLRRLLNDADLEPLVQPFLEVHAKKVKPDSLKHIEHHVRHLIPADETSDAGATVHHAFPRSRATVELLTTKLYAYDGKPGTVRKVHADWSVFFTYCTRVKGLFDRNPMDLVERPPASKPLVRFYELDVVERIVGWQPTPERRALFALLYGTGIEISVALLLTRADIVDEKKHIVRAAGTKTHTRDRQAKVADWAWPTLWAHAKTVLPAARIFPAHWSRHTCSDWHRQTIGAGVKDTSGKVLAKGLELPQLYPMYNARHHWAVRMLRAGTPVKVVQEQLGHASPMLTLNTYGQFAPSGHDRDHWEAQATAHERARNEGNDVADGSAGGDTAKDTANAPTAKLSNSRGGT